MDKELDDMMTLVIVVSEAAASWVIGTYSAAVETGQETAEGTTGQPSGPVHDKETRTHCDSCLTSDCSSGHTINTHGLARSRSPTVLTRFHPLRPLPFHDPSSERRDVTHAIHRHTGMALWLLRLCLGTTGNAIRCAPILGSGR